MLYQRSQVLLGQVELTMAYILIVVVGLVGMYSDFCGECLWNMRNDELEECLV